MIDYLIVGAGFAGCVLAERLASRAGRQVLVIDKRDHIGGNAYDRFNESGILIHPYGPHIFHTNSERIFNYLSQFSQWRAYEHRVLSSVVDCRGATRLVPFPINLDTINTIYGLSLTSEQMEGWLRERAEAILHCRNSEEVVISQVGRELYEKFFRGYTRKQWNLDPTELDAQVARRIPTRTNKDDRYFTDTFQFMPLYGYTRMFEKMLEHPNIHIELQTSYREACQRVKFRHLIYTGPIDEFFDYRFGRLPYRSLEFHHETIDKEYVLPLAQVNYPDESVPFTRMSEFKWLTGQKHLKTAVLTEYPRDEGEPYYPIPAASNRVLYSRYRALADETPEVTFVGRLASYQYYNMDQVVGQALSVFEKLEGRWPSDTSAQG